MNKLPYKGLFLVNHTKKEYTYVGEAEDNDVTFVFNELGWDVKEKVTLLYNMYGYESYKMV